MQGNNFLLAEQEVHKTDSALFDGNRAQQFISFLLGQGHVFRQIDNHVAQGRVLPELSGKNLTAPEGFSNFFHDVLDVFRHFAGTDVIEILDFRIFFHQKHAFFAVVFQNADAFAGIGLQGYGFFVF